MSCQQLILYHCHLLNLWLDMILLLWLLGIQLTLILHQTILEVQRLMDERSSLPSSFDRSLQEKEAIDDHDHEPRSENDDDTDDDVW